MTQKPLLPQAIQNPARKEPNERWIAVNELHSALISLTHVRMIGSSSLQKPVGAFVQAEASQRLLIFRRFLLLEASVYITWWFVIHLQMPHAYNPFWSRALVTGVALLVLFGTYKFDFFSRHVDKLFYASLFVLINENFWTAHFNFNNPYWLTASYIAIFSTCACFRSQKHLAIYSIYVFAMGFLLSYVHDFQQNLYIPNLFTILVVCNLVLLFEQAVIKKLFEATDRLEKIFHATFEGICILEDGIILDANDSFATLFQYKRSGLIGNPILPMIAPESKNGAQLPFAQFDGSTRELWALKKNGTKFPIEISGKPHQHENREAWLLTLRDLSEHYQAQAAKEEALEAQAAVKLRDQFISLASHELRTPITPIKLSNDMLLDSILNNEPITHEELVNHTKLTQVQLQRMQRLIEEMLDVSRISHGNLFLIPEDFQIDLLAEEVCTGFAKEAQSRRNTIKIKSLENITVSWDSLRIQQILSNLIKNAITYAPASPIRVSIRNLGEYIAIKISDKGIGIRRDDFNRIFQRYERAVSEHLYGGLGLGLYIVDQIVKAHHGKMKVYSQVGKGSSFLIVLPRIAKNLDSV